MRWPQALLVVLAYLLGSVPPAYIFARTRKGADLRKVGSGNVGGSNLRRLEGAWATVLVGILDIMKAAIPVWVGLRLGLGEVAACSAGIAVVIAHDWCPWLGFKGGRGVACTLGVLLAIFPYGALWLLVVMGAGALFRQVGLACFVAVLLLPGVSLLLGRSDVVVALSGALAIIAFIKRLEANRGFRTAPSAEETLDARGPELGTGAIYLRRLLLDRDR